MIIEERELYYRTDSPLRAWRLFRVRSDGEGPVLSSPMYHDDSTGLTPLWLACTNVASCYKDHEAPAAGCRCGIYGAIEGTIDSLPGYLLDTAYETDLWAYAEIACYGRVFVDMRGVRAERADLCQLALPGRLDSSGTATETSWRALGLRYGVPVGALAVVPDWVTTNRRSQGPPPDDDPLDLHLSQLDLTISNQTRSRRFPSL